MPDRHAAPPRVARALTLPIRWSAWLGTLMALVIASAPVLATLHRALVPHAVCEHGDLIELGQHEGASPADMAPRKDAPSTGRMPRGVTSIAVPTDVAPVVHAHSHCVAEIVTRSHLAGTARAELVVFEAERSVVQTAEYRAGYLVTILLNAPKTSPPA